MVLLMKELLMQSTTVTKFLEKVTTFLMEYPQKELPDPPPGKPCIFCFVHDTAVSSIRPVKSSPSPW